METEGMYFGVEGWRLRLRGQRWRSVVVEVEGM